MTILNTSVSGMLADSNWLSSISQNVANANTTGYKNQETDFSTVVDAVSSTAPGGGVMTSVRSLNTLQGNIVSSATSTNLAVQGSGFFVVSDSSGAMYLTRNGSFVADASGNLVNSAGYYLMGSNIQNGSAPPANALSSLQKVNVASSGETASPTTSASIAANLPSTATPVAAANLPSANSASSTYTDQTSLVVYDNLGGAHTINLYLTNTGANTWEVDAFDASAAAPGGGFPYSSGPLATGTLTFNPTNGTLSSGSPLSFTVPGGQTMSLDLSKTTQLAAGFQRELGDRQRQRPGEPSGRLHRVERDAVVQLLKRRLDRRLRHPARQCGQPGLSDFGQRQRVRRPMQVPVPSFWARPAPAASARSNPRRSKTRPSISRPSSPT